MSLLFELQLRSYRQPQRSVFLHCTLCAEHKACHVAV